MIEIFESLNKTTQAMKSISEDTNNQKIDEGSLLPLEMVLMNLSKIFETYKEKSSL